MARHDDYSIDCLVSGALADKIVATVIDGYIYLDGGEISQVSGSDFYKSYPSQYIQFFYRMCCRLHADSWGRLSLLGGI